MAFMVSPSARKQAIFMADLAPADNPKCRRRQPRYRPTAFTNGIFTSMPHSNAIPVAGGCESPVRVNRAEAVRMTRISREREQVMRVRLMVPGLTAALAVVAPLCVTLAKAAPAKGAKSPAAAAAPTPVPAVGGGAEPTLIGQFGSWGAYSATPGGRKVCFALAKPSSSKTNPPNRPRDPAYVFVSTRPAEKVSNEVSVAVGSHLKP